VISIVLVFYNVLAAAVLDRPQVCVAGDRRVPPNFTAAKILVAAIAEEGERVLQG
jgi:hypothetical protein